MADTELAETAMEQSGMMRDADPNHTTRDGYAAALDTRVRVYTSHGLARAPKRLLEARQALAQILVRGLEGTQDEKFHAIATLLEVIDARIQDGAR
jgi:hypothetical protein